MHGSNNTTYVNWKRFRNRNGDSLASVTVTVSPYRKGSAKCKLQFVYLLADIPSKPSWTPIRSREEKYGWLPRLEFVLFPLVEKKSFVSAPEGCGKHCFPYVVLSLQGRRRSWGVGSLQHVTVILSLVIENQSVGGGELSNVCANEVHQTHLIYANEYIHIFHNS